MFIVKVLDLFLLLLFIVLDFCNLLFGVNWEFSCRDNDFCCSLLDRMSFFIDKGLECCFFFIFVLFCWVIFDIEEECLSIVLEWKCGFLILVFVFLWSLFGDEFDIFVFGDFEGIKGLMMLFELIFWFGGLFV